MGKKKKITKILEALKGIIGDSESAKKLKKKKAFENFLEKLQTRRKKVEEKLASVRGKDKGQAEALEEELALIVKSIRKGERLLDEM